jgi:hypothetical protein
MTQQDTEIKLMNFQILQNDYSSISPLMNLQQQTISTRIVSYLIFPFKQSCETQDAFYRHIYRHHVYIFTGSKKEIISLKKFIYQISVGTLL